MPTLFATEKVKGKNTTITPNQDKKKHRLLPTFDGVRTPTRPCDVPTFFGENIEPLPRNKLNHAQNIQVPKYAPFKKNRILTRPNGPKIIKPKNQDENAKYIPWSLSSNEPEVIEIPTPTQSHYLDQIKLEKKTRSE